MEPSTPITPAPRVREKKHPVASRLSASSIAIGIGMVILGAIALGETFAVGIAAIFALGIVLIVGGVAEIVMALTRRAEGHSLVVGLAGVLSCVAGILLLLRPTLGLVSLTLIIGCFFLANGAFRLITALVQRYVKWGWDVAYGISAIVLGVIVLSSWPNVSVWLIGTLIGIELLFRGAAFLGLGVNVWQTAKMGRQLRA